MVKKNLVKNKAAKTIAKKQTSRKKVNASKNSSESKIIEPHIETQKELFVSSKQSSLLKTEEAEHTNNESLGNESLGNESLDNETLGQLLKNARKEKKLSVEFVAEKLKIRSQYLTNIENNDYHLMPEPAYVIGFIKAYAKELSLEESFVINKFKENDYLKNLPSPKLKTVYTMQEKSFSATQTFLVFITLTIIVISAWYIFFKNDLKIKPELSILNPDSYQEQSQNNTADIKTHKNKEKIKADAIKENTNTVSNIIITDSQNKNNLKTDDTNASHEEPVRIKNNTDVSYLKSHVTNDILKGSISTMFKGVWIQAIDKINGKNIFEGILDKGKSLDIENLNNTLLSTSHANHIILTVDNKIYKGFQLLESGDTLENITINNDALDKLTFENKVE